jgi:UDP-glucose 4-epimerase
MESKKILVTGSRGFIGQNFCRKNSDVIEYDIALNRNMSILNIQQLEQVFVSQEPKIVLHLAANANPKKSVEDPLFDCQLNIEGTINLLQTAVKYKIEHLILASTAYVYGPPQYYPIDEKHPLGANTPYGISKKTAESYCLHYFKKYGLNITILRFFTIYGLNQLQGYVIPDLINKISQANDKIELLGTKNDSRDFLWMGDLIDAIKQTIKVQPSGEILNIGGGDEIKIYDIALKISKLLKKKIEYSYANVDTFKPSRLIVDIRKTKDILGWTPKTSIDEGLKNLIEDFQKR